MPNAKILAEKQAIVATLTEKLKGAPSGVFVDYQGITVAEDTALRVELRKNDVEYAVVKNTLARLAIKNVGYDELDPILNGTTSLAVSGDGDSIAPFRVLNKFSKQFGEKRFHLKAGFMDGRVLSLDEVRALADLPSKEVLLAKVLGTLLAPITSLAIVVKAIAEQGGTPAEKSAPAEEAAAPAEAAAAPAEEAAAPAEEAAAPAEEAAAPAEEAAAPAEDAAAPAEDAAAPAEDAAAPAEDAAAPAEPTEE